MKFPRNLLRGLFSTLGLNCFRQGMFGQIDENKENAKIEFVGLLGKTTTLKRFIKKNNVKRIFPIIDFTIQLEGIHLQLLEKYIYYSSNTETNSIYQFTVNLFKDAQYFKGFFVYDEGIVKHHFDFFIWLIEIDYNLALIFLSRFSYVVFNSDYENIVRYYTKRNVLLYKKIIDKLLFKEHEHFIDTDYYLTTQDRLVEFVNFLKQNRIHYIEVDVIKDQLKFEEVIGLNYDR